MRITSAANLPISVFFALGAAKTGYDYVKAEPKDKKDVLVRNSIIIGSSIMGVVAAQKGADLFFKQRPIEGAITKTSGWLLKVPKPKFLQNFLESLVDVNHNHKFDVGEETQCTEIIQNCLKDCFMVASAIGSGLIGGSILNKTYFKNKKPTLSQTDLSKAQPNYNLVANPDDGIEQISKVLEGDFKAFKTVDQPMAVFDALKISAEKDSMTKMKMTAYELIANALLPTFFISLAMSLTKNLSIPKRIGLVGASGGLGILVGHRMAVQFNRTVTPEIVKNIEELKEDMDAVTKDEKYFYPG